MSIEQDVQQLALQEELLQFNCFDHAMAWELGQRLKDAAHARGGAVAIEIQFNAQPLFFYAMQGTTPDNAEWIRRKRNVVMRFQKSSYAVGLTMQMRQTSLPERFGLNVADYTPHGGCFPLRLRGTGCIGTIAVSGLPQREDHNLLVEVLAEFLGLQLKGLALAAE